MHIPPHLKDSGDIEIGNKRIGVCNWDYEHHELENQTLRHKIFKDHKNTWNGHKREANWSQKELS